MGGTRSRRCGRGSPGANRTGPVPRPSDPSAVHPGRPAGTAGQQCGKPAEHLAREREQVTLDAGGDVPVNVEIERGLDGRQFAQSGGGIRLAGDAGGDAVGSELLAPARLLRHRQDQFGVCAEQRDVHRLARHPEPAWRSIGRTPPGESPLCGGDGGRHTLAGAMVDRPEPRVPVAIVTEFVGDDSVELSRRQRHQQRHPDHHAAPAGDQAEQFRVSTPPRSRPAPGRSASAVACRPTGRGIAPAPTAPAHPARSRTARRCAGGAPGWTRTRRARRRRARRR